MLLKMLLTIFVDETLVDLCSEQIEAARSKLCLHLTELFNTAIERCRTLYAQVQQSTSSKRLSYVYMCVLCVQDLLHIT